MKHIIKVLVLTVVVSSLTVVTQQVKAAEPILQVLSPNRGENLTWGIGQSMTVQWQTIGEAKKIDLAVIGYDKPLSKSERFGYDSLNNICFFAYKAGISNKNIYTWKLNKKDIKTKLKGSSCQYFELAIDRANHDVDRLSFGSDGLFGISWYSQSLKQTNPKSTSNKKPSGKAIQLLSPNKASKYKVGNIIPVRWQSDQTVQQVSVVLQGYHNNNDDSLASYCHGYNTSGPMSATIGKFDWVIDRNAFDMYGKLCPFYKIFLYDWNGKAQTKSDKFFTIAGTTVGLPPAVKSAKPTRVWAGAQVVILGTGFLSTNTVELKNNQGITITIPMVKSKNGKEMSIKLPSDIAYGDYQISVSNSNGTSKETTTLSILEPLSSVVTIINVSPKKAESGSQLVIKGTGFLKTNEVYYQCGDDRRFVTLEAVSNDGNTIKIALNTLVPAGKCFVWVSNSAGESNSVPITVLQ